MAWILLFLAGLFEIGWPIGLKLSQTSSRPWAGISFSVLCIAMSGWLLWLAQKSIPLGTAYAVWTGVGTVGTFAVGVAFFGDTQSLLRWSGVTLILLGIVLLKMSENLH